jgi:hypothetical protein
LRGGVAALRGDLTPLVPNQPTTRVQMSMMGMSLPELPFPADEVVAQIQAIVGGIPAAYESEHAKLVSE